MATLTVQEVDLSGETISFTSAASGGDKFTHNPGAMVIVENNDTVSKDVTVTSQEDCDQGYSHDETVTVAAGDTVIIGGLDKERFADANDECHLSYSDVTSLNVAVVRQVA